MALRNRVRRLAQRATEGCTECGLSPGDRGQIVIVNEGEHREQEYCPGCDRPKLTIIRVVYDE